MRSGERGQSLVELAVLLPLLLTLALVLIEGSFIYRAHNALVTATWIGARFALDGGSDTDIVTAIQYTSSGFQLISGRSDIYVVRGGTNSSGVITSWSATHPFGTGGASPRTSQADLQGKLQAGLGSLSSPTYANIRFILVEVDYTHSGVTGGWVMPINLPMRSYAVMQSI